MKKNLLILTMTVLALSCSSEGGTTDKTALKLVTGVNFRQNPEDSPLTLGNPNVMVNNKFVIYPNPANGSVFMTAQENVTDVWIVPATPQKIYQEENFNSILNSNLYSDQTLGSQAGFSLNGQATPDISLDLTALPKGYYRVFAKIGGQVYWDNLYTYGPNGGTEAQFEALNAFWN